MSQLDENLQLLMVQADEQDPCLRDGLDAEGSSATDEEKSQKSDKPLFLHDEGTDPNSLPDQRWGLIVPEGERGKHLESLLGDLLEARRAISRVTQVAEELRHRSGVMRRAAVVGAVGLLAAEAWRQAHPGHPTITLETAHPSKFLDVMEAELGVDSVAIPERLAILADREKVAGSMGIDESDFKDWLQTH